MIIGERKDHHLTPQDPKKQINYLLEAYEFQFIKRNYTNIPKTVESYIPDTINLLVNTADWMQNYHVLR